MKTQKITCLLLLILLIQFYGCQFQNRSPDIEKAISDLTDKFPQLPKGKSKQSDYYRLVRSVNIGESNIQLQLRSTPDSLFDPQQIILIINAKGDCYAIPYLSNKYRDYWNFQFDKPIPDVKKVNTTFEKELMTALNILNLNDSIGTGMVVVDEIIYSLLQCRLVMPSDSDEVQSVSMKEVTIIPSEDFDECSARTHRNFKEMMKVISPSDKSGIYLSTYWDQSNDRIYQLDNKYVGKGDKIDLRIKVFRQNCNCYFLEL